MQKIHFTITINAPREKVWDIMLSQDGYAVWTEPFNPGSYFRGDWSEGSKMLFLGPNSDGSSGEGGMVSRIKENRLYEYLSIEHQGFYKDGVEDTTSNEAKKWTPAYENYTFKETDAHTVVEVDMDVADEYKEEFEKMWQKALEKLKEICEK